jgi:hypothetical protein
VVPGTTIETTIIRSGEGDGQGIAYLPDGAMIVVEGASDLIGETLEIEITNAIQRPGGKLVFGKIIGDQHQATSQGMAESATTQPPTRRPENRSTTEGPKLPRNPRRKK